MKRRVAMRTTLKMMAMFAALFLAACGGGGQESAQGGDTSQAQLDAAKATLSVDKDKTVFQPAMVGNSFVHLSDGAKEVSADIKQVSKIFWNGPAVGFHSADPTKGVDLQWDGSANPAVVIAGRPLSMTSGGNFSFLLFDGRELTQNTDAKWLKINATDVTVEVKGGLIYGDYSNGAVAPVEPNVPGVPADPGVPVEVAKTLIKVNTLTGDIEITPVIVDRRIVNLVDSNPSEVVLDESGALIPGYRIVWNDSGSWYPQGGNESQVSLPTTVFPAGAKPVGTGAGMPYLVRPDGTFVSFNTDPTVCTFMVNDVITQRNTDGLFPY